jgi:hypothetical protein
MKITPAQISGTFGALLFLATATFAAAYQEQLSKANDEYLASITARPD